MTKDYDSIFQEMYGDPKSIEALSKAVTAMLKDVSEIPALKERLHKLETAGQI